MRNVKACAYTAPHIENNKAMVIKLERGGVYIRNLVNEGYPIISCFCQPFLLPIMKEPA